jgi:hypothetical protein
MCLTNFVAFEALLHKRPATITEIQEKVGSPAVHDGRAGPAGKEGFRIQDRVEFWL